LVFNQLERVKNGKKTGFEAVFGGFGAENRAENRGKIGS
jgi:hypothetical protein